MIETTWSKMSKFKPTKEQQDILGHDPRIHARVLAGPGTGKSATLVAYIDALLAGEHPPRIKLLTFTRAATAELVKKVSEHPAAAAERPSTIHSFSISILLANPGAGDLPQPLRIADDWENSNIVHPILARRAGVTVPTVDELLKELAANFESLTSEENPEIQPQERARFLSAWNEDRQVLGYTLLAELPYQVMKLLEQHPDVDGIDYDLLVVDEYQDLNACDLRVLKLIADRGCTIIGAGDDDQSIYAFRKAAPEGIRQFLNNYDPAKNYPLSETQRCGRSIIEWASYVIESDPDRPSDRPSLVPADGSPEGETALLAFKGEKSEAKGIAALVKALVTDPERPIAPADILILLRTDRYGRFSKPIKKALDALGIDYSDPDAIKRQLADANNRWFLACFRLLVNPNDSLAWSTVLYLTPGIGWSFINAIYDQARDRGEQFGPALLAAYTAGFPGAPKAPAGKAALALEEVLAWLTSHREALEERQPDTSWGEWMLSRAGGTVPEPTPEFQELLLALDDLAEPDQELSRYLGQIAPLGKDRALAESPGVRVMNMAGSKGLTVRATIVAGLEEGIIPRPSENRSEERRLLYVAMTRSREVLFGTWARRRRGPTARSGAAKVNQKRRPSSFFDGGPVTSKDGDEFLCERWPEKM